MHRHQQNSENNSHLCVIFSGRDHHFTSDQYTASGWLQQTPQYTHESTLTRTALAHNTGNTAGRYGEVQFRQDRRGGARGIRERKILQLDLVRGGI